MSASFFEKITGASADEEKDVPQNKKPEQKISPKKNKPAKSKQEKIIKKQKLILPKKKNKKISKKSMPKIKKTIETKPAIQEIDEEEKDWLEEAEGEEEGKLTIDVYQTKSDVIIKSTIAGVRPENIDISVTNDMITIRGRRQKDEEIRTEDYYYQELYWGAFSRSIILPVEVDASKTKAIIRDGILTIKLPKAEKLKTKKIKVEFSE